MELVVEVVLGLGSAENAGVVTPEKGAYAGEEGCDGFFVRSFLVLCNYIDCCVLTAEVGVARRRG